MNLLTSDVCLSYNFVGILFEKKKSIFSVWDVTENSLIWTH